MKKLFFVIIFVVLAGSMVFAAPATKAAKGGNGNGGADKIGGYLGYPLGLSYSHEFNDFVELDLVAAYNYFWTWHSVKLQMGALFTVFDPVLSGVGNQHCPLTVGPVIGGRISFGRYGFGGLWGYGYTDDKTRLMGGSIDILAPLRWEINFKDVPDFNLFIEAAPIGMAIRFIRNYDITGFDASGNPIVENTKTSVGVGYTCRYGLGLRYRIPNKK